MDQVWLNLAFRKLSRSPAILGEACLRGHIRKLYFLSALDFP